ncbi:hypothetical protein SGO26_29450 (plasmid) [Cupriavidus metallidurans]|uniref:hypothetical protein n=1 Tax=Cupriavidus metallidurans TaxID=119219 RepID=UPI003D7056A3
MHTTLKLFALGLSLVGLAGCSTPQAALDQARNTAALTVSLSAEQREFRRVQTIIANSRIESIRRQTSELETYEAMARFDDRVRRVAGLDEELKVFKALRDLSDSRSQDEVDLAAKLKAIDDNLATILTPLPESTSKVSALQKALLPLGEELSSTERTKAAVQFAKSVKEGLDASKQKLAVSEAVTPTAPPTKW